MLQLVYMSLARAHPTSEDVEALCEQASRNNARDEITGVLLAHGLAFLQILEGPRTVVENTFVRIMRDDRHHAMLLLHLRMTTVREFGAWSMAMCGTTGEKRSTIERVRSRMTYAPTGLLSRFDHLFGAVLSGLSPLNGTGRRTPAR